MLATCLSSEKQVKVQDPPGSLTGSSGAKIEDLAQLLNEQVPGHGKHVEESSEELSLRVLERDGEIWFRTRQ